MARIRTWQRSRSLLWQQVGRLMIALTIGLIGQSPVVHAQTVQPPSKGPDIVINPTIAECKAGWQSEVEAKWTKEQFEKFCAILNSPAPILANPTLAECDRGWNATTRWTAEQFDAFCVTLRKSK